MCGIAGFSLDPKRYSQEQRDILSTMLALGIAARGTDSWGIATGHGEATVGLGSIACLRALESIGNASVAIMHARYRTVGPITLAASHPFVVGNHTFAHNGAIWNHDAVGKYLVDSIALGDALSGKVPWSALDGYGAMCWFRAGRPDPRIARLTKEGELWVWEGRKGTIFASTKRILETAMHYAEIRGGTAYEARLGMVYRLTPEGLYRYKKPVTRFRLGGRQTWASAYCDDDGIGAKSYLAGWVRGKAVSKVKESDLAGFPDSDKASTPSMLRDGTKVTSVDDATWARWKANSLGTSRLPAIPECIGIDDATGQVYDTEAKPVVTIGKGKGK